MNLGFAAIVIVVLFLGAPSLESIGARAQRPANDTECDAACSAARIRDDSVIRGYINQGISLCECECSGAYGGGILHVSARLGCGVCISLLTTSPANCPCDDRDVFGDTPLHLAAGDCNIPTTSDLIRAGCDSNAVRFRNDDTPLCLAARRRNDDNCGQVVRTLLSTNVEGGSADPCQTCRGETACESCAYANTCNVLEQDGACNC